MTDNSKPTSIRASEWSLVAEDVKAGRCVVAWEYDDEDDPVIGVRKMTVDPPSWMLSYASTQWAVMPAEPKLLVTWLPEQSEAAKPTVITAAKLVETLGAWAMLKDAGRISLLWKDDHIDGIGKVGERYVIQYGGIVNDPDYVTGDAIIGIEWLPEQPEPAKPTARPGAGDQHISDRERRRNKLVAEYEKEARYGGIDYEGWLADKTLENEELQADLEQWKSSAEHLSSMNDKYHSELHEEQTAHEATRSQLATANAESGRLREKYKLMLDAVAIWAGLGEEATVSEIEMAVDTLEGIAKEALQPVTESEETNGRE